MTSAEDWLAEYDPDYEESRKSWKQIRGSDEYHAPASASQSTIARRRFRAISNAWRARNAADWDRRASAGAHVNATDHSTTVEDLDWQQFRVAYFPGSGRHDLEAIVAYGAYKRSLAAGDQPAREAARLQEAAAVSPEATSLEEWEDEGGAAR
jgi:hypothetical protein